MRLLVKKDGLYAEIFRVGFYKSQHWSVIGEYLLFDILESMIPEGTKFHSHFIYVETGDYHFSIKYFDIKEQVYVDRKTYFNHIATRKKADSPNFNKADEIVRRDKNLDDPLDSFMMGERLKPWTERPLGHHFGTVAVNLDVEGEKKLAWDNTIKPDTEDLVIDINLGQSSIINFGAGVYSDGNPAFQLSNLPDDVITYEKAVTKDDLVLRLNVIIVNTKTTKS
ncbi:hypothetical protein [Mucilaginibacter sp.]|uniref:hypothetical protein n=1 Tax=Mucilaginibacter sp. TaxID=1882438 RepID=UPI0035BC34A5